ncbi:hypothetical protein MTO96_036709, partial [Rhipicephalus appendiculatus]
MLVWASTERGECLLARVRRQPSRRTAEAWLYLRTADGHSYVLPTGSQSTVDCSHRGVYAASGLRLEQLMPMRRWRVAFNGLLRLLDEVDSYAQLVFCTGSVSVNGEAPRELFLWGFRIRSIENGSYPLRSFGHIMGRTKSGITFFVREVGVHGLTERYQTGLVALPSTEITPVTDCSRRILTDGLGFKKHFMLEFAKASCLTTSTASGCPDTLSLDEDACRSSCWAGGKGASLASLRLLAKHGMQISVPEGFVVTTVAYEKFSRHPDVQSAVQDLSRIKSFTEPDSIEACNKVVRVLESAPLPEEVQAAIRSTYVMVFGEASPDLRVAVRSSAV